MSRLTSGSVTELFGYGYLYGYLHGYSRWLLTAIAVVLPAAMLHAALPNEPDVSGRTSFSGQLLIASPDMRDPFDHAVVLMAQHTRDGALGIVINHPLGQR